MTCCCAAIFVSKLDIFKASIDSRYEISCKGGETKCSTTQLSGLNDENYLRIFLEIIIGRKLDFETWGKFCACNEYHI